MRPADIKSREVELGSHSWMDSLAAELFLNSCFLDTVFVALFHTTVETAFSKVHKLLGTGGVLASLTLLFWWWCSLRSLRVRALGRATHWFPPPPPPPTNCPRP